MLLALSVPLFNEGLLVERVVGDLLAALAGVDVVVALVDNGSTDGTGEIVDHLARDSRVVAVHLAQNAGYGGGIIAGIEALIPRDPDVVGWLWGDGQVDPAVVPVLLEQCRAGAMLAKARRTERLDGLQRRVVTTGYALVMRALGVQAADVNGCPKLLRREAWETLAPQSKDWFLDAEVVLGCEARGWPISDKAVVMAPREAGHSKVRVSTLGEFALNLARWKLR